MTRSTLRPKERWLLMVSRTILPAIPMLDRLWVKALVEAARLVLWTHQASGVLTSQSLINHADVRAPRSEAERLMLLGIVSDIKDKMVSQAVGDRAVADIIAYLRAHSREQRLTRARVSRALDLSESWLAHRFKHETGVSFAAMLSEIRLADGVELLRKTDASIKEIALTIGFRDPGSFSRVFRARFNSAPAAWRRAQGAEDVSS